MNGYHIIDCVKGLFPIVLCLKDQVLHIFLLGNIDIRAPVSAQVPFFVKQRAPTGTEPDGFAVLVNIPVQEFVERLFLRKYGKCRLF
jgi:hypothetical protein